MALTEEDKQWIRKQLDCMKTELLNGSCTRAFPMDLRQRTHEAVLHVTQIDFLLDRIKKLEEDKPAM